MLFLKTLGALTLLALLTPACSDEASPPDGVRDQRAEAAPADGGPLDVAQSADGPLAQDCASDPPVGPESCSSVGGLTSGPSNCDWEITWWEDADS